ncbi:MAG: alpha-L-fucosidase [Planctomycetes bacterium]|nr:alpha-L-fucosidase [Planctomycetota bacterium]
MAMNAILAALLSMPCPTPEQAAWQDDEIGMFIHFAPNTWTDREGDDLSLPLEEFDPKDLDTDQWVAAAEAMGAKYIVFVAKHVGGFCMWRTETTDYGVRNTPWRGGKGDVLADLSASCRKKGMKLGVYLSPCDRKLGADVGGRCADPVAQARYDEIYRKQLTEVLTRYGEMCEVWFDGSIIIEVGDILKARAPRAMVFQGPHATIRWVGNEDGFAPDPAWNAVSEAAARSGVATAAHGDPDGTRWMPLECDARIRSTWFWNTKNADTLKSVERLMAMYYRSVGRGAVLLLNQTPDTTGRIPEADVRRGAEFGAEIRRRFGESIAETSGAGEEVALSLPAPAPVDHVIIMEDLRAGERVREYAIEGLAGGEWTALSKGTSIGHKKIDRFRPRTVEKIRFRAIRAAAEPKIRRLAVFSVSGAEETAEAPSLGPVYTLPGEARAFDGGDSRVNLGDKPFFRGDFTIAARVFPRASGKGNRIIVSKETCGVGENQCRFYISADDRLGFMMSDAWGTDIWPFESDAARIRRDAWSRVAIVRRGSTFILYLDGQEVGRKESPEVIRHENRTETLIGAVLDASGSPVQVFDGRIDEFAIFNRALVPTEMRRLAALARQPIPRDLAPPAVEGGFIRPAAGRDALPRFGFRDGIRVGLWPGGGPRGLIRIYAPYVTGDEERVINFVAVEPIVAGRGRGLSELEPSAIDGVPGKRFWIEDALDGACEPKPAWRPSRGRIQTVRAGDRDIRILTFAVRMERFQNGAHPAVEVILREDRPREVGFRVRAESDSAAMRSCILTATMGNYARLRHLWLRDAVVAAPLLWPDYDGTDFAPPKVFPLERLFRDRSRAVIVAATPDEADPASAAMSPGTPFWWRYRGRVATQYWKKEAGTIGDLLFARVNARRVYWASRSPIPGGISYENFELEEPFEDGAESWFGVTLDTPETLGFTPGSRSRRSGRGRPRRPRRRS